MTPLSRLTDLAVASGAVALAFLAISNGIVSALQSPLIEGEATAPSYVVAGEVVPVEWEIVKRVNCPGMTARVWSGESGFQLAEPMQPTALPATRFPAIYQIQTEVPELAPPGELRLGITGFYECSGAEREWFKMGPVSMTVVKQ